MSPTALSRKLWRLTGDAVPEMLLQGIEKENLDKENDTCTVSSWIETAAMGAITLLNQSKSSTIKKNITNKNIENSNSEFVNKNGLRLTGDAVSASLLVNQITLKQ